MPFLLTPAASAFSFRIASVAWLSVHGVGEMVSLDHQIPVDLIIQRIRDSSSSGGGWCCSKPVYTFVDSCSPQLHRPCERLRLRTPITISCGPLRALAFGVQVI